MDRPMRRAGTVAVGGVVGLGIGVAFVTAVFLYFFLYAGPLRADEKALRKEAGVDGAALKYALTSKAYRKRRSG
jgi:hypothetical protein